MKCAGILIVLAVQALAARIPLDTTSPAITTDPSGRAVCRNCVYATGLDPLDPHVETKRAAWEAANPHMSRCTSCFIRDPKSAITKRDTSSSVNQDGVKAKRCFVCYFSSSGGGSGGGFEPDSNDDAKEEGLTTKTIDTAGVKAKRCFWCYFGSSGGGSGGGFEPGSNDDAKEEGLTTRTVNTAGVKAKRCFACYWGSSGGGSGGGFEPDTNSPAIYTANLDPLDPQVETKRAAWEAANPHMRRCTSCFTRSPGPIVANREASSVNKDSTKAKRCFACYWGSSGGGGGGGFEPGSNSDVND